MEGGLDTADWDTRREIIRTLAAASRSTTLTSTSCSACRRTLLWLAPISSIGAFCNIVGGVITPPWGTPWSLGSKFPPVPSTPAFSHCHQKLQHPPVADPLLDELHQQVVVDAVVERLDVQFHDPVRTTVYGLTQLLTCLVRVSFRPEPVRALPKRGFEDRLQHRFSAAWTTPSRTAGTVTSYCFSYKYSPGFRLDVVRVGDAFAAGGFDLRCVRDAQSAGRGSSSRQVTALDPVVDSRPC